jgi:Kdo2-lipid IVA lauroyltransferase/acyltransferase
MLNFIRNIAEYLTFSCFYMIFSILPMKIASKIGAAIGIYLSYFLKANQVAKKNLKEIMPELNDKKIDEIAKGVWENMGRYIAEYPHITSMSESEFFSKIEIRGEEYLKSQVKSKKGFIIFSAHFSNFEIIAKYLNIKKVKANMIFREANNPYINKKIVSAKKYDYFFHHPKGMKSMPKIVKSLLRGEVVATFIDQKLNEGEKVKFMGKDAMTAMLPANLALKYKVNLLPVYVVREKGRYILNFEPAINAKNTKFTTAKQIMSHLNKIIAKWIKANPEQWFWVHNRWIK